MDHTGKIAVVTGAARGLGREIAATLARNGATVVLCDILDAVHHTARELTAAGLSVDAAAFDVADVEAVAAAFAAIQSDHGRVDILVNNAGIVNNYGTAAKMDPRSWDREIAVNLSGVFYCTRQVLAGMAERRWGRVISTSSMVAHMGLHGAPSYAASKAGILGFTRTVALENFRYGITANAVCPGVVRTDDTQLLPEGDQIARMLSRIPGEEWGRPQDVAFAVDYLASQEARFVNGIDLAVDAGARLFYTGRSAGAGGRKA